MFIPYGCISGKAAKPSGALVGYMEAFSYRLKSTAGNSVFLEDQKFISHVGAEATNYIYAGARVNYTGLGYVLLAATTNAYDLTPSDTFLGAIGGGGWSSNFSFSAAAFPHRLVTSDKVTGAVGTGITNFISNVPDQNNVSWTARFASNTQDVVITDSDYMGNGFTDNLVVNYSGATVGETSIVVMGHQLSVTAPVGYTMIFSKNVVGSNTSVEPLASNHKITVYWKVLTAEDISNGFDIFYTQGYTPSTDSLLLEDDDYILLESGDKLLLD